jgi:hypothetical protein
VAVAFGVALVLTCGEALRLAEGVCAAAATLGSGVAVTRDSVTAGVAVSGLEAFCAGTAFFSALGLSGRASCEDIIAGSTGAPGTVVCPVGARRAGGVYLLFEERGGNSCCRRTPLYLKRS